MYVALISELFPPELIEWAVFRFIQLIPIMVLFYFIGRMLDLDNQRFKEEEEKIKQQKQKENLKRYF